VGFEPPLNGAMPLDLPSATKPAARSAPRVFRAKARGPRLRLLQLPMLCDQVEQGVVGVLPHALVQSGRDYEVVSSASIRVKTPKMVRKKRRRGSFPPPGTDSAGISHCSKNRLRARPKPRTFVSPSMQVNLFAQPAACWFLYAGPATSRATSNGSISRP